MRRFAWLLVLALAGCAFGRRATMGVDEYSHYRRYRIAATLQDRLAAGHEYLVLHPSGVYKDEIRNWFGPAQAEYLRLSWNDADALRRFLGAVPRGDGAKKAAERLVELELEHQQDRRTEEEFEQHVGRVATRLEDAERGRRELVTGFSAWVARLAAIRQWYRRTSELDDDFIYEYRLADHPARCDDRRCVKTVTVEYAIPEKKSLGAREAVYDVVLELSDGGVRRAVLTGPELFSRIGEAVYLAPVPPSGHRARIEAIARTSEMVAVTIESTLPEARCTAEAVGAVVLHRRCDGVDLRVIAALDITEEDRVVVEPASPTGP